MHKGKGTLTNKPGWFFCLVLLAICQTVWAGAVQQQQHIIQQQQQRQEFLQQQIEQQQDQHQQLKVQPPEYSDKQLVSPCFDIDTIELQGSHHMPAEEQKRLLSPFIRQCVDLNKINQLLEAVSQWYFEQGYVTSRAYVAAQDLSDGRLIITVVEGTIESFQLLDPASRINLSTAFPAKAGEMLNLRDIEQGLEQINRLQSYQATMELVPGQTPGATQINIKSQHDKPWELSLSRDNGGQPSTGELMNGLFFSLDNPLGLNDYSYLQLQKDIETDQAGKASKSRAWHWDMPLGSWSFGFDISYFEYLSTIRSTQPNIETSGTNLSQKLYALRMLSRDQNSKLKLALSLERKKTENFIEDVLLDSSRKLAIANIGLDYKRYLPQQRQWQFKLDYYRGLKAFGAPEDKQQPAGSPKAQFDKFIGKLNYQHPGSISLTDKTRLSLFWHSELKLQYSNDRLFGSEQISIGSLYTVRGYKNSSLSASSGAYWRNTLTFPTATPWGGQIIKNISPFIGLDIGVIRDKNQSYSNSTYARLKGWAVGIQLAGQYNALNLVYARPIDPPHWMTVEDSQWYFSVSANI